MRKTTFVAFAEAEIDQLIYLATEHANREVGAGKEAYDIRIGSKGVPLVATRPASRGPRHTRCATGSADGGKVLS